MCDFFEDAGAKPTKVMILLLPLAIIAMLAMLLDDLFCCVAAAN
jgi:hypothetical protein